jgi:con80 domain of Katanin
MVVTREYLLCNKYPNSVSGISMSLILNIFYRLNDTSVTNDFIAETFAQNQKLEHLSMESAPAVLAHCLSLVNSKYEAHMINGVRAYRNVFNLFRDVSIWFLTYT